MYSIQFSVVINKCDALVFRHRNRSNVIKQLQNDYIASDTTHICLEYYRKRLNNFFTRFKTIISSGLITVDD